MIGEEQKTKKRDWKGDKTPFSPVCVSCFIRFLQSRLCFMLYPLSPDPLRRASLRSRILSVRLNDYLKNRNTPITFPRIDTSLTMIGSMKSFSG